jgi:hypothetical protein
MFHDHAFDHIPVNARKEELLSQRHFAQILSSPSTSHHLSTATRLEDESSTLGLLVTTDIIVLASVASSMLFNMTYPSSKCLQRLSDSCALVLHCVHSSLSTTFLVVLAFLWKTGFV